MKTFRIRFLKQKNNSKSNFEKKSSFPPGVNKKFQILQGKREKFPNSKYYHMLRIYCFETTLNCLYRAHELQLNQVHIMLCFCLRQEQKKICMLYIKHPIVIAYTLFNLKISEALLEKACSI